MTEQTIPTLFVGVERSAQTSVAEESNDAAVRERLTWWQRHPDLPALFLGVFLAVGVCLPLIGEGRVYLLDWVSGPHMPLIPPGAMGLSGGLVAGVPFAVVVDWLVRNLGAVGSWVPLLAIFPLAAWGVSRLVGGSLWCRLGAATLYCVNPFVFQRIYVGHLGLLLGYALLPLAVTTVHRYVESGNWWIPTPALWWAVLTALSPHFVWIYGVVLIAFWSTHGPTRIASVSRLAAVGATFALMSLYILLPHSATQLPTSQGTSGLLALYRTTGDPHLGLFPNVLGLYGFWRLGPTLPKNVVTGWPFLLLALLFVAAVGALARLRRDRSSCATDRNNPLSRRTPAAFLIVGIVGYFLALGDQGPTGALFRWAYFHVPFFDVMEEPQKFLMLTALAYAVFFGWGVERLTRSAARIRLDGRTVGAVALAVLLPLTYAPTIFDGLAGQIAPSHLPATWQTADQRMGNGPGQILFLPWHLYLAFPFTNGRVISNPAPTSFRRSVISGDNLEAGVYTTSNSPRSGYLEHLFTVGPEAHDFGSLIAPLGVKYVVLAKAVDWRSYTWLSAQAHLRLVMNSPSLEVWRNTAYTGVGESTDNRVIQQISPVAYTIGPGPPGLVSLDAPYQKGWELDGQPAARSPQGTIQFRVGQKRGVVRFQPWGAARLGYIVSGTCFVLLSVFAIADRVRRRVRESPAGEQQ